MLRRFAGESLEQMVFWSLIAPGGEPAELPLGDIAQVGGLLQVAGRDGPC